MAEYATIKLAVTAQIISFPSHRIVRYVRHGRAVVVNDTKLASVAADAGVVVRFPDRPAHNVRDNDRARQWLRPVQDGQRAGSSP
jgi:hypothetical protein